MIKVDRAFCVCFVTLVCASLAHANDDIWRSPVSGNWNTNSAWADGSYPGSNDQATFDKAGTYTVTFLPNPTTVQDLFVTAGNVTFTTPSGGDLGINVNSPSGGQDVVVQGATLTLTAPTGYDGTGIGLFAGDDLDVQLGGILNVNDAAGMRTADLFDNFSGTINVSGFTFIGGLGGYYRDPAELDATSSATVGGITGTSTLNYSNYAQGSLAQDGTVVVGSDAAGILNLDTQAYVSVGNLSVGASGAAGTINVNSLNTLLDVSYNSTVTVGATSGGSATINVGSVTSGATFRTENGAVTVNATGSINVGSASTSGTFDARDDILVHGGAVRVSGAGSQFTVATSTTINSNGAVSVDTGGQYNTSGNILISGGTINVNGSNSMFTQTGAHTLIVGDTSGAGTINVGTTASGGTFSSGTGQTTINANGVVNVGSATTSGTFTANGDLTLGGTINIRGGSTVNLQTVTVNGGSISLTNGTLSYIGNLSIATGGLFGSGDVTFGNNQQVTLTGSTTVDPAHTLTISGGTLHTNSVSINGGHLVVGSGGGLVGGPLSIISGGSAAFAGASGLVGTTVTGSGSLLNLQSASDELDSGAAWNFSSGGGLATGGDFHLNSGTISIDGAGSTATIAAAKTLRIGDVVGTTTGVMNVTNEGALTVGAGGTTLLTNQGTLNINGGSADLKTLNNSGGALNFTAGSLSYLGNLTVGTGGLLGSNLILNADRQLTLSGTTTVDATRMLTLSGGTLTTGSLLVNGTFSFIAGTLAITQAGAAISTPIVAGTSSTINVNANSVSLGLASSFTGFNYGGVLNVGAHSVTLNSAAYAQLGVLTTLAGGTISAPNGVYLAGGGSLVGNGAVNTRITGDTGSVIQATGALALGDATSPAGYVSNGELRTKQFAVTLNSTAQAALGNLTTLGNGASAGTLNAANGLFVDFGHSITGFGTINSSNTLAKPTIINGVAQGNSVAQPLTFSGYVKGDGTFNNVNFTGTFSPGFSPTLTSAGNLSFAASSTLEMEIGGITAGTAYDEIQATGALLLGGTLHVSLINGFMPTAGQSFDILDWGTLSGAFLSISLPTLSGLTWNTSQLYTTGVISVSSAGIPGDYNNNGLVDAADYVAWRKNQGTTNSLPNDPNGGTIGTAQYGTWRSHFGQTAGSGSGGGSNAAVPEPTTLVLLIFATAGWCVVRCRAK